MDYTSQSSNPIDFSQNISTGKENIIDNQKENDKVNLNNVDQTITSDVLVIFIMIALAVCNKFYLRFF